MSGFDLQDRLAVPIIFITAHEDAATLERIEKSGASGHLRKPFGKKTHSGGDPPGGRPERDGRADDDEHQRNDRSTMYRLVLLLGLAPRPLAERHASGPTAASPPPPTSRTATPKRPRWSRPAPPRRPRATTPGPMARGAARRIPPPSRAPSSTPPIRKSTGWRRKAQRVPRTRPPIVAA